MGGFLIFDRQTAYCHSRVLGFFSSNYTILWYRANRPVDRCSFDTYDNRNLSNWHAPNRVLEKKAKKIKI